MHRVVFLVGFDVRRITAWIERLVGGGVGGGGVGVKGPNCGLLKYESEDRRTRSALNLRRSG